jgi:hypothetical protein
LKKRVVYFEGLEKLALEKYWNGQGNYGYAVYWQEYLYTYLKCFVENSIGNSLNCFIMLCFVQGISMLIYTVFALGKDPHYKCWNN